MGCVRPGVVEPLETNRQVLQADPREGEEPPHHQRVQYACDRPVRDDAALEHHFRKGAPKPLGDAVARQRRTSRGYRTQAANKNMRKVADAQQKQGKEYDAFEHAAGEKLSR